MISMKEYSKLFFHIDVNSAFLSWSAVKNLQQGGSLDLRTIPAIIGGDRTARHGIVLAKSIPAKKYGIETAEPIVNALRKCPSLVIEPPDMPLYKERSRELMEYLSNICPDIEQVSIDECYMDFTPVAYRYSSPEEAADMIRTEVRTSFGYTVNIGISDRKVLAKMASDFEKPDKTHTLFSDEIEEKMWPLPISGLFMCGHSSQKILHTLGITTIGELARTDLSILTAHLKSHGRTLYEYANGIDSSVVITWQEEAKGVGHSTTLSKDVLNAGEAYEVLKDLANQVSRRLKAGNHLAGSLCTEIKYATFQSVSHQTILAAPSADPQVIYKTACRLFDDLWDKTPIRLLGIRATRLTDRSAPVQMSIFDYDEQKSKEMEKQQKLDDVLENIRKKYGNEAITRGTKRTP